MLRFAVLASGSGGNATLVEGRQGHGRPTRLLIDCGLGPRVLQQRLAMHGLTLDAIDAVFLTHEHSDHVHGVTSLSQQLGWHWYASDGTWEGCQHRLARRRRWDDDARRWHDARHRAQAGETIVIGDLCLAPYAVPHDAREPLQLVVSDGVQRLGVATDLGHVDEQVVAALQACDALILEANHDADMLADGPYPSFLRRRIAGDHGHLANGQAADLLRRCQTDRLHRVVAAHLSQQNNEAVRATAALAEVLGSDAGAIVVAQQDRSTDWLHLRP